jgi:hypothetical protein
MMISNDFLEGEKGTRIRGEGFENEICQPCLNTETGQEDSSNKENKRIMECFAKIKELDKKIFQNEVILWENKARLRGELDILWEDINGMIENGSDEDSCTSSVLLPLNNPNAPEGFKNELPSFDLQNVIQENFSSNPIFAVLSRQQNDVLSTIESVGSLSDEDSVPVDEDLLCDEKGDPGSEHQTNSASTDNKAQKRNSNNASGKWQNFLSEIEEEKIAILLNETNLNNDRADYGKDNGPQLLQNDCYGGKKHAEELCYLDSKLIEEGYCNDFGETSRIFYCSDGFSAHLRRDRVLVELADQRFLREKQRCINDALEQLKSFPLSLTDYNCFATGHLGEIKSNILYDSEHGTSFSSIYKPLTENDIRVMVADAEVELNGRRLLCHEDIARLLMEIMRPFVGTSQQCNRASQ